MTKIHHSSKDALLQLRDERASPFTVLQVENDPANALLVAELIARRDDLQLITATRGYPGIEIAQTRQPDLILMDINLDDINGIAALKMLRHDPLTAHIPVIAMSSNVFPSQIAEGLAAGFFRYLTKPFNIVELMAMVDAALAYSAENRPTKSS